MSRHRHLPAAAGHPAVTGECDLLVEGFGAGGLSAGVTGYEDDTA